MQKLITQHGDLELDTIGFEENSGRVLASDLEKLDRETAALVIQSPNFFGSIEELSDLADKAHEVGALLIVVVTEAISFGLLKTPGACGADIVVAEGQSFGVPMVVWRTTRRIVCLPTKAREKICLVGLVGVAYDKDGNRGFVLTLATREQHIRREKATSNICTNQGLIALAANRPIWKRSAKKGLQEVAMQNVQKAAYASEENCRGRGIFNHL